jgi:hypothetical protein
VLPPDFNVAAYEAVHRRVNDNPSLNQVVWEHYAAAWNGLAYRFLACADNDTAFTTSIRQARGAPRPPERYVQERELFYFFVTGLASIESLCFGLFAIGSMLAPVSFPMKTAKDLTNINPIFTAKKFKQAFLTEQLTNTVNRLITAQEFKDWKDIRNILAHRAAPGRVIYASLADVELAPLWKTGITLDEHTTSSRRQWLAQKLDELLNDADTFTMNQFP